MTERASQTRRALVEAAIAEIERVGLSKVTIRGMARAAQANVAAVNYHFGSKEGLIREVLAATRAHMIADAEAILSGATTASEALGTAPSIASASPTRGRRARAHRTLVELLTYLLQGALRYPQLTRAHVNGSGQPNLAGQTADFDTLVARMADVIRGAVPGLAETTAEERCVAALSAVLFITVFPAFFADRNPSTPEGRERFVRTIADGLLAR